jgi:hypothetical protein
MTREADCEAQVVPVRNGVDLPRDVIDVDTPSF